MDFLKNKIGLGAFVVGVVALVYYVVVYKVSVSVKNPEVVIHGTHIETLYGTFNVQDQVILDLIDSPAMQRTKNVHQYGVAYFLDTYKFYTRYEHSVGVWAILRRFGADLDEQIAGLLHDASHTVFSHLGDYIFNHSNSKSSYQDAIHEWYLNKTTVPEILKKHGMSLNKVMHKSGHFDMLERDLPDMCADRIEYNIKGGLVENLISRRDVSVILDALRYEDGRWFFTDAAVAYTFARISLHLTEHEWGSAGNFLMYTWAAAAVRRAMAIGLVSYDDIHFSTDDVIWHRLVTSDDPEVKKNMTKVKSYKNLYILTSVENADHVVATKFRGINPWVKHNGSFERLTDLNRDFSAEYNRVKQQVAKGWAIKLLPSDKVDNSVSEIKPIIC